MQLLRVVCLKPPYLAYSLSISLLLYRPPPNSRLLLNYSPVDMSGLRNKSINFGAKSWAPHLK